MSERNNLFYGDCLEVLRKHVKDESVDLIYLDPPFNSNRDYNVLFKEQTGAPAEAQVKAFTDTWKWSPDLYAEWDEFVDTCPNQPLVSLMQSFIQYLKRNDVTAYLARMTPRLYELHRVLKPTGSLYLHCDPAASHYLKIILDMIFGPTVFRNEVVWKRTSAHNSAKRWGPIHDVLHFYTKSKQFTWNDVPQAYDEKYINDFYRYEDEGGRYRVGDLTGSGTRTGDSGQPWKGVDPTEKGRHWAVPTKVLDEVAPEVNTVGMSCQEKLDILDAKGLIYWPPKGSVPQFKRYLNEEKGVAVQDMILDILPLSSQAKESLGYPTQKPVALLKRILEASSNPGDIVLDPFCGCGTTIMAAQELGRKWIGIDITATATSLIKARLLDSFGIHNGPKGDYDIIGLPSTEAEATELASRDKHEFQKWAISKVPRAMPWQEKKGADGGVDGFVRFRFPMKKDTDLVIISVKGGQTLKMDDIKNLEATVKANKAAMGFLITLVPATKGILEWAAKAGYIKSPDGGSPVPVIQVRTVAQLLRGEAFAFPWNSTIHGIPRAGVGQGGLDL